MLFRLQQQQRTNISTQQQNYRSVLRLERTSSPGDLQLPPRPPRRSSSSGSPSLMASPETVRRPEPQTAVLLRPQEICQRLQRLSAAELGNNSRQVYHSEVQKSFSAHVNGQPKRVLEECRSAGENEPERPLLVPHPRAVAVRPFRSVGGPQPLSFGGEFLKMRPLELSLRPLTANLEDVHPNAGQRTEMRLFVQGELLKIPKPQFWYILFSRV